jgi:hypothetical protein
MTITKWWTAGLAIAAAAAAVAAAGCGGSGPKGASGGEQPDDAKQLAFARCMREAGIDFPDPTPGAGARPDAIRIPRSVPPKRFLQIEQACRRSSGIRTKVPSAAEQARFRDDALKFARCMRAHGVDLPDPQMSPDGGGIVIQKKNSASGGGSGPAVDSPAFRRAAAACPSSLRSRKLSGAGAVGRVLSESAPPAKR